MTVQERDLIVLGSGPGGYVAAIRASQLGRKVSLIERESLGGVCLNWGCIPTKALLRSAQLFHDMGRAKEFGLDAGAPKVDFNRVMERSREVAGKLSQGVNGLMRKNKVEVIMGHGTFEGPHKVAVKDSAGKTTVYTYKDIIIATGARARPFPGLEADGEVIHNYRSMLSNRKQPGKLLVIGSGAIGIEFAYFMSSLGTQVTVVEMMDQILPVEDTEISQGLQKILAKNGMTFHLSSTVENLKRAGKGAVATIKTKDGIVEWSGDMVLTAIGIVPNTENLGLEKVGIKTEKGFIKADSFLRTSVPHHYAIGDVIGAPALAHKASHEAIVAAEAAAGKALHPMRYDNIPGCTYCQPQVASVGMTERAAKEKGLKYKVAKMPFSAIGKAIAIGEPEGMIKVIIDQEVGEVLGVHILHSEATELISEAAIIRSHEGIAASVLETIHPHPTLAESMGEVMALALGRPVNF
jgi:dihydrolipoamide dehydrogenase